MLISLQLLLKWLSRSHARRVFTVQSVVSSKTKNALTLLLHQQKITQIQTNTLTQSNTHACVEALVRRVRRVVTFDAQEWLTQKVSSNNEDEAHSTQHTHIRDAEQKQTHKTKIKTHTKAKCPKASDNTVWVAAAALQCGHVKLWPHIHLWDANSVNQFKCASSNLITVGDLFKWMNKKYFLILC